MINNLQHGDRVSLDTDNWDLVGRTFTVMAAKFREDSTAVELVIEDTVSGDVLRCVVARNQIVLKDPVEA